MLYGGSIVNVPEQILIFIHQTIISKLLLFMSISDNDLVQKLRTTYVSPESAALDYIADDKLECVFLSHFEKTTEGCMQKCPRLHFKL